MARFMNKIDAKGRIFVPAKVRDKIGPRMFVTVNQDKNYLSVYSEERFDRICDAFDNIPTTTPEILKARRAIIGEALECEIDSQGRISVTSELWERIGAKPSSEICIYQLRDMLEICTAAYYESSKESEAEGSFDLQNYEIRGL
ncbi:MAG: hypothetical protein J6Y08_11000 [Clostridiales bacterium]|nr:hypothetical protein [Clostridiales bacterium]